MQQTTPASNAQLTDSTEHRIREETQKDEVLSTLYKTIIQGWPDNKSHLDAPLKAYWGYREELSVNNDIIYKGTQVLVPHSMHSDMLQKIHANHLGAESNIRMARDVLFWPGMRKAIHDMCNACQTCAQYGNTAPKEPMKSLPVPTRPWQLISQDIFSFQSEHYLATVCHFSDWIEVDKLENLSSTTVVEKTKAHFSRFGIPSVCHTDNGPQFSCTEYENFSKTYAFQHTTSSPYHTAGNGRAEAGVKLVKTMMEKSKDFHVAMLHYRNTPPKGHMYSPAQRMLLRRTRTTLPTAAGALTPQLISYTTVMQDINAKRVATKQLYDKSAGSQHSKLDVGSYACARPLPNRRGGPWSYGVVTNVDRQRSYTLQTPSGTIRRNRIHLQPASTPQADAVATTQPPVPTLPCVPPVQDTSPDVLPPHSMSEHSEHAPTEPPHPSVSTTTSSPPADNQTLRRSTRDRRLPVKLQDFVVNHQ